jgi:hypothetical protein
MSEITRAVSKETQKIIEEAEMKSPDKLTVVIEENKEEQEHHDFDSVKKTDITSKVLGDRNLINSNKEEKKMEEVKLNKEVENKAKFVSFVVFKTYVRKIQDGEYYSIKLRSNTDGGALDGFYEILLRGNRLSKVQPSRDDLIAFWLFGDEKVRVTQSIQNPETKEWEYVNKGNFDATDIVKMMHSPEHK